jgi:hypothetical protein
MTDAELAVEVEAEQTKVDEAQEWLDAVASWHMAGKPRTPSDIVGLITYRVSIKNNMHGYESYREVLIEAEKGEDAIALARAQDTLADSVTLLGYVTPTG